MHKTHKCLLESGVEIQKRLESNPVSKRMGTFRRPRSASLRDTPKKLTKGEKGRQRKKPFLEHKTTQQRQATKTS